MKFEILSKPYTSNQKFSPNSGPPRVSAAWRMHRPIWIQDVEFLIGMLPRQLARLKDPR